jgi:hypothetical protein
MFLLLFSEKRAERKIHELTEAPPGKILEIKAAMEA